MLVVIKESQTLRLPNKPILKFQRSGLPNAEEYPLLLNLSRIAVKQGLVNVLLKKKEHLEINVYQTCYSQKAMAQV